MAPTESSVGRKPSNRMTAEIADFNGVPRSTQEHGTFKWTNRSWYAIEDKTPCDYLVKYETRGVARGMIRFARLEAQTNAPISVGELAVRVAALQEAHDATTVSGLVQAKMRLKIGRPWKAELIARGYGKWDLSQLFWSKMEDGEGDEMRAGKAPAEEEESEDDGDEEMGEEIDVDDEPLPKSPKNYNGDFSSGTSVWDQPQIKDSNGLNEVENLDVAEEQLLGAPGTYNGHGGDAPNTKEQVQSAHDDGLIAGDEMDVDEEPLVEAPVSSNSTLSGEASDAKQDQTAVKVDFEAAEEMIMDKAPEDPLKEVNIEANPTQQLRMTDSDHVATVEDDDMDVDLEQIFDEEGRPILDANPDLDDLRLLFPNGNW